MRIAGCGPFIGLLAAVALAQTTPDRQDVNRKVVESAMPRLAPGLSQAPEVHLPPIPALRTSFVETAPLRKNGTNQNPIARAVRNLASRIFPRKGPDQAPATTFTLFDRRLAGTDFHLTTRQGGVSKDIR